MNFGELSDLEEGEILEYDSYSPVDSSDDFQIKNRHLGQYKNENLNCHPRLQDRKNTNWCLSEQEKQDYYYKEPKGKHELNSNLLRSTSIDLESISSEGEYKSDSNDKYRSKNKEHISSEENKMKRKCTFPFYGTVEDIMSEIGETICRKSRCNYKKRKSKDFVKYSDNSYDLWRDKVFSTHLKGKRRKRKLTDSNSESEFLKVRVEKRRKKKRKREVYYDENETSTNKPKTRDFDEMRRNLLEKLKKQKAEEKLKELTNSSAPEVENSEIQEVDMLIECTNYVDVPTATVHNNPVPVVEKTQEKEGEDEMDLIKLRLIALASNKKRKSIAIDEAPEDVVEVKKTDDSNREEVELERTELLLRAEALKTALLKKHQKRLNKLKVEKSKAASSSSDNDVNPLPLSSVQESEACKSVEMTSPGEDCLKDERECKTEEENKFSNVPPIDVSDGQESPNQEVKPTSEAYGNPKKINQKPKGKRKKRKSSSFANNLKENSEKNETLEEDDCTLRSQLLSDLMRRKSLKDLDKKPVLTDSVRTANQIPSLATDVSTPKGNRKPLPMAKKNILRKVNVAKVPKMSPMPKVPVPEIQRIIVHLGSEDSSDENGGNEDKIPVPQKESETKETLSVESSNKAENATEKTNEVMKANYEKSVELLLSQARRKIEGKLQTVKTKAKNSLTTPEAVYKHLPLSQRLEYIRLKQKIAERERLMIQSNNASSVPPKTANSLPNNSVNKNIIRSSKTVSKLSQGTKNANGVIPKTTASKVLTNKTKTNVAGAVAKLSKKNSTPNNVLGSNSLLLPSSQALISKLKLLLKKIKIEKTIEENYEKEISKLKNQLSLFERKKTEQRFKIKKLGEESMKTYRAIQGITSKSEEKTPPKSEDKKEDKKDNKKEIEMKAEEKKEESKEKEEEEEEGKKVPNEPETDSSKAESKIDKEPNSEGDNGGPISESVSNGTTLVVGLLEYISPLEVFKKATIGAERVDPNVTMCHFDLMGVCKDEECTYQHLRTS